MATYLTREQLAELERLQWLALQAEREELRRLLVLAAAIASRAGWRLRPRLPYLMTCATRAPRCRAGGQPDNAEPG